ncbi:MAG TPA: hypothetical protein VFP53_04965 [Sphingomicrobium sp.]|nr:hypothetical protein [Sphingomicrobium sp.]
MIRGRMPFRVCGPFLLAFLAASCADSTSPTASENRQLENAAEMLDSAPGRLNHIDSNTLEDPAANSIAEDQ